MPKSTHPAYDKLTQPKQKKFVQEYMVDFNAGRAYVRAGYSPNGADQNASREMRKDKMKAAIDEALEQVGITPNRIKSGLAAIAFGNEPSKIVTGVSGHREQDRAAAMRELSRIEGMITEKHEVQVGPIDIMFDDGEPGERAEAARAAVAERRKASEGEK